MKEERDYGCWSCGSEESRVTSTARDSDGNRIRRRRCERCGGIWLTEERRLAKGTRWFQRAESAAEAQRSRRVSRYRRCRWCKVRYETDYPTHLRKPKHRAWQAMRKEEVRQIKKNDFRWRYWNDPVFRQQQIESASRRGREQRARNRRGGGGDPGNPSDGGAVAAVRGEPGQGGNRDGELVRPGGWSGDAVVHMDPEAQSRLRVRPDQVA